MLREDAKGTQAAQELSAIVSDNLRRLIGQNHLTQKELADRVGVTAASMTDYCRGRRLPNAEFFVALKNLFGISIDDFLTGPLPLGPEDKPQRTDAPGAVPTTMQKYCGLYYVCYFDTGKYKGRDTLTPQESLLYGILYIYSQPALPGASQSYGCAAVLGLHEREEARSLKQRLEALRLPAGVLGCMKGEYFSTAYFGSFDLSQEHAFISMRHAGMDQALIIFHRVDNNKENYRGGIGTINSVSKGRERMPVIQFIGISRYPVDLSEEEIHRRLLLSLPTCKAEEEAGELIRIFKTLYGTDGEPEHSFSELQKSIMIRSALERYILKSLERNVFRYGKVSEWDDDEWYHAIKDASVPEE